MISVSTNTRALTRLGGCQAAMSHRRAQRGVDGFITHRPVHLYYSMY